MKTFFKKLRKILIRAVAVIRFFAIAGGLGYALFRRDCTRRFDAYAEQMGIDTDSFRQFDYRGSSPFSRGLPYGGFCVVYKNEPEYLYRYDYLMVSTGLFSDNIYPDVKVYRSSQLISKEDYHILKNCVYEYEDYLADKNE